MSSFVGRISNRSRATPGSMTRLKAPSIFRPASVPAENSWQAGANGKPDDPRFQDPSEWFDQVAGESLEYQDWGYFGGTWTPESFSSGQSDLAVAFSGGHSLSIAARGEPSAVLHDVLPYGLQLDNTDKGSLAGPDTHHIDLDRNTEVDDNATEVNRDVPHEKKRRIQNREAQRAFRERKVKYVQQLEKQVEDSALFAESLKHENSLLRTQVQWLRKQLKDAHQRHLQSVVGQKSPLDSRAIG